MNRRSRKGPRPIRAFVYAVLIHVAFGAMLGVTLWVQPRTLKPVEGKPVQAKAIDLAAIEREKQRIAAEKKKAEDEKKRKEAEKKKKAEEEKKRKEAEKQKKEAEEEKKRQAEEKKKAEEEKKRKEAEKKKKEAEAKAEKERQAEEKKKAEQEKKRIEEEQKKKEAEAKAEQERQAEAERQQNEQDAVSAFGAVAWAIQEQVRGNWNPPAGDFNGMSVSFTIRVDREGNVTSVKMSRSSGNARLDESAENAIYKASPLPIPSEARFYEYLKEFEFVFSPQN